MGALPLAAMVVAMRYWVSMVALAFATHCSDVRDAVNDWDARDADKTDTVVEVVDAADSLDLSSDTLPTERVEAVDLFEVVDLKAEGCGGAAPHVEMRICRSEAAICPLVEDVPVPHVRGSTRLTATLSCVPEGLVGIKVDVAGFTSTCPGSAYCDTYIDANGLDERIVTVSVDAEWTGAAGPSVHRSLELPVYNCRLPEGQSACLQYAPWEEEILVADTGLEPLGLDVIEQTDGSFHVYLVRRVGSWYPPNLVLDVLGKHADGLWAHETLPMRPAEEGAAFSGSAVGFAIAETQAGFELVGEIPLHSSTLTGGVFLGRRTGNILSVVAVAPWGDWGCSEKDLKIPRLVGGHYSATVEFSNGLRHVLVPGPRYYVSESNDTEWKCDIYPQDGCASYDFCYKLNGRQLMKADGRGGLIAVGAGQGGFVFGRYNGTWAFTPLACDPGCYNRENVALAIDNDARAHVFSAVFESISQVPAWGLPWAEMLAYDALDGGIVVTHENLAPLVEQQISQLPDEYSLGWLWGLEADTDACGRVHAVFTLFDNVAGPRKEVLIEMSDLPGKWTTTPFFATPPHRIMDSYNLASHSSFHITPDGTMHLFAVRQRECPIPLDCAPGSTQLSHWFRRCEVFLEE